MELWFWGRHPTVLFVGEVGSVRTFGVSGFGCNLDPQNSSGNCGGVLRASMKRAFKIWRDSRNRKNTPSSAKTQV